MVKYKPLVNGCLLGEKQKWINIINPTDGSVACQVPALTQDDINAAFQAAVIAQPAWARQPLTERIKVICKLATAIRNDITNLATVMMAEVAKGYQACVAEINRTLEYLNYSVEEAKRLFPHAYTGDGMGFSRKLGVFQRVPRGVVLAIAPFNYPFNLALSKIIPALLAGNAVVFKGATNGSGVACLIGQYFMASQAPAGIINVITGRGRDIGTSLVQHPQADVVLFTGSVSIGRQIQKAYHGQELVLELGGKDPILVLPDSDLTAAGQAIIKGGFSYSGQRCTAVKLVLVLESDADQLVAMLKQATEKLSIGPPQDNNFITPLITPQAADYVEELITDAVKEGAKIIIGGQRDKNLIYPTIVDYVTPAMRLGHEEPFGPVIPIIRCRDVDHMIWVANHSIYGLQASIFTSSITWGFRLADQLNVGTVNINGQSQRGPDSFPFLGVKASGIGVQGIRETFKSVTRLKGVVINY